MQIIYAFRSSIYYPHHYKAPFPVYLPPKELRAGYLKKVRSLGFEGVELSYDEVDKHDERGIGDLAKELSDAGLPCLAIRGGGGMHNPRVAVKNRQVLEKAVRVANALGATVVNMTSGSPTIPGKPGSFVGDTVSQNSSRDASEADYQITAKGIAEVADIAAGLGIDISIEVHQNTIADNIWSSIHLLEMIDRSNVGLNPDLGNVYWCYDVPEQTSEAAIVALAPHANYWHCKNLIRVHIPENEHSIFIRKPLPDGEIDYRFAISAMLAANYQGYLAVEGMQLGDRLTADGRSVEYVKNLIAELKGSS